MSAEVRCEGCGSPTGYRNREVIADTLHAATVHCATQNTDWAQRFNDLLARIVWIEGELRSLCSSCVSLQFVQLAQGGGLQRPTHEAIEAGRLGLHLVPK